MQGKIGLEEHFAFPPTLADSEEYFEPDVWPQMRGRLIDLHDRRLAEMDELGMEMMILSLNAPTIQAIPDRRLAIDVARRANDFLAEQVVKRRDRFAAFAALPMQDPDEAARELTRCVKDLGFKGALVNGFSQVGEVDSAQYYDLPGYWPFWETVARLDVPFYLHPRDPLASRQQIYEGHPWLLGSAWAFGVETATHALRLMGSGLFDAYPNLTIILGHLGEGLPGSIWRVDHRIATATRGIKTQKTMQEYFSSNFYITTSGNFRTQTLIDAILEIGSDRILFSTDYPFERMASACAWFDTASISENDRLKIGRRNALSLFRIGGH